MAIRTIFWLLTMFFGAASVLHSDTTLNFPRLSTSPDLMTGIAIANPSDKDALVTLTAYGADGLPLKGDGIGNPVDITIPAGQQIARVASDLFGAGVESAVIAWFQATSRADGLTGFFLLFNSAVTQLDGADIPVASQKCIFNLVRLDSGHTTELNIVNPGNSPATVQLALTGALPMPVVKNLTLAARGVARLDVASFFLPQGVTPGAYVAVDSDVEIAGFELIRSPGGDAVGLNARRSAETLSTLYFPRLQVLGPNKTELGVVNYSSIPVVLTISALKPDGTIYSAANLTQNPVTRALPGGGSLREDLQAMFGFSGAETLDGWIAVRSTSESINGYLYHTVPSTGVESSVTSAAQGKPRAIFSQIATAAPFFTSLTLLNQGTLATNVRILAIKPGGGILGSFDTTLPPGRQFSAQLGSPDFIPAAANQSGGILWVKSDLPIYMASAIGNSTALANVPPQDTRDSYNPDAGLPPFQVKPSLAIVPPGNSQRFQWVGSGPAPEWKVNGSLSGDAVFGTITGAGVFTAPKKVPAPQVVTITADSDSRTAGASADVLEKSAFINGLKVIQSVVYLSQLKRIYAAEFEALAGAPGMAEFGRKAAALPGNSQIFEVSPNQPKALISPFPGENVAKIISFTADDQKEYLLLLGQTTGRVIRLNTVTKEAKDVVTGLNEPSSMVFDPATGNLLVVEKDRITAVPASKLQPDLRGAVTAAPFADAPGAVDPPAAASLQIATLGGAGIAVDRCSGNIYFSLLDSGEVIESSPFHNISRVVASGLSQPGQLLGVYRKGVSCPDAFHLLVAETGADRVTLIVPSSGTVTRWVEARGIRDLAFVPRENPFTSYEGVLLADWTLDLEGIISLVPLDELYEQIPYNPAYRLLVNREADFSVTQTVSPSQAGPGDEVTFTATVLNAGPDPVTGLTLHDRFINGGGFSIPKTSQGSCSISNSNLLCSLGTLTPGAEAVVRVQISPKDITGVQSIQNIIDVTGTEVDPNPGNNQSTQSVMIGPPTTAAQLAFGNYLRTMHAGTRFGMTIAAQSQSGDPVTGYAGTIQFHSSDPRATLPPDYTFTPADNGKHTFTDGVTLRTAGRQTLTVQDLGAPDKVRGTADITVEPATPAILQVAGIPSRVFPGLPLSPELTIQDLYGNLVSAFRGRIHFVSSDPAATLPPDYTFTPADNGSHTFLNGVILQTAGTQMVGAEAKALGLSASFTSTAQVVIQKATPVITWSNPAQIVYGTPLGSAQLNATASVSGTFAYTPTLGTVLTSGLSQTLRVDFTPSDAARYSTASKTMRIDVLKATPSITWNNPANITYAAQLSNLQLNAGAPVPGTFLYTPPAGSVLSAGPGQALRVDFTPSDTVNFNPASKTVWINVLKATPVITWCDPADVTYGTPLSVKQLNATASVTGTFTYTPPAGTILPIGSGQRLRVDFTPVDVVNYSPATATVSICVLPLSEYVHAQREFLPLREWLAEERWPAFIRYGGMAHMPHPSES